MLSKKVLFLLGLAAFQANSAELSTEHKTWVEELSTKYDISEQVLTDAIGQAKFDENVLTKIQTPWEKKPWYKYAPIFITDSRINQGVKYWQEHEETFAKAEKEYGVPAQMIVAIMGVETYYGKYKGNLSVLDSLYTLGFNYPSRGKFFRQEFAEYIKLSEQQGWELTETKGSYAGAMGLGQFISSSYSHYGVDFSGDGKVDMINDPVDAIGSIANYFSEHKWQTGGSVAYPVTADSEKVKSLLSSSLRIKNTWSDLTAAGVTLKESDDRVPAISIEDSSPVKLLKLEQADSDEYWVYLDNFYTITRYNHSPLYAMAVFQLSERIKQAKHAQ
ncbi:lytic murein transglycosylase B [Moritella sp. F3]|uniref:lytic murein transglycosylase B n=1 Tax=Moritella sp. F3 TaxID=2718882 RepID=UPI0018E147D7|nr:lytic murein transglycosylase B [Moritella sp. F3]GIC77813.1 lytic murein transglycosylase B [Moritella sp. F1]GIC83046.1 lytic murein transglycosylase B [Moritella sp. F3]